MSSLAGYKEIGQPKLLEKSAMASGMILTQAKLAAMAETDGTYGLIDDAALVLRGGFIAWAGPQRALPGEFAGLETRKMGGRLITPALIDCHTHIVFGGNRAQEFEMRLRGASYQEIARAGGGILSTVRATRAMDEEALLTAALPRVDALIKEGVSLIEVKSGYGLDRESELRMLRAARRIARVRPIRVVTSFLGAHATPPEYQGRPEAYLREVCIPTLRTAHAEGLADAVDGFCEGIAFSPQQIALVFEAARGLGLPVKLHAEQLSNLGGAKLAAAFGALSADHIEYLDEEGVKAMARAGTVGVLLPGAFYALREAQAPPVALLRQHNVPLAVASDLNPGSSPLNSLLLAMNMACTLFRLTPEEALAGVTRNAAKALGLGDTGAIAPGLRADLAVWDVEHPAELAYHIGYNPLYTRIFGGDFPAGEAL